MKVHLSAMQIQRIVRGKLARNRVETIVEALYDTGKRNLEKERQAWILKRRNKAATALQMYFRRILRRKKILLRLEQANRVEEVEQKIRRMNEKSRVEKEVYQNSLKKWYEERKKEYDLSVMNENQTKKQKKIILDRRNKRKDEEKLLKKKEKALLIEKLKEEKIETFIKEWDLKSASRAVSHRKSCHRCLIEPSNPMELELLKILKQRIPLKVKDVLRRADKKKIPMEIPEATKIATQEVIEDEVVFEMERCKIEMKEEGKKLKKWKIWKF